MVTQTITINLTQSRLAPIIMRSEEKGREIQFEVINEAGEPEDLTDYNLKFMMLKPDGNVVYADLASGILTQTEQMTTSKGKGYYCIRIMDDDTIIYSGQGPVVIDDHVIDDETLESISEVDGYVFPDDFATVDQIEDVVESLGFAKIADDHQNETETWSSEKIAQQAAVMADALIADNQIAEDHTWSSDKINTELNDKAEIDDETVSSQDTWSSSKISDEISDGVSGIIDDNNTSASQTWSSDKIADEIAGAGGGSSDDYTTTETQIGTWLGDPLYRRVDEISGVKQPGNYYTLLNDNTINLIKYEGCVLNQYWTGAGCMLNSYYNSSNYCGCSYSSNDGARIDWYNNLGMAVSKIYLIIYYTKK